MLKATAIDSGKLSTVLAEIIMEGVRKHKLAGPPAAAALRFILVDHAAFYNACGFSRLRRVDFAAEVQDCLTNTQFVKQRGTWLYTEYEAGVWLLVHLAPASVHAPTKYLARHHHLVEVTEIPVDDVGEDEDEDARAQWYIDQTGAIMKYNPKDEAQSVHGDDLVITGRHGVYTTRLYKDRDQARRAVRVKPAPVDQDDDAESGPDW